MVTCIKIDRKVKRVSIGALNRKIIVNFRSIVPPSSGSVDFTESFIPDREVWALIETVAGVTIFDETNTAIDITHNVYIRYYPTMTPEKWVNLLSINGGVDNYLNIMRVENLNEENRFYKLLCNIRGNSALPVNEA